LKDPKICPDPEPLSLGTTQFCAWSAAAQPATFYGLQKGDSGGPLVRKTSKRPEVAGVASAACSKSGIAIFEDVSRYRDWIIETVCGYYSKTLGGKEAADCRRRLEG
jgi:secreted trypsin-like serine protease